MGWRASDQCQKGAFCCGSETETRVYGRLGPAWERIFSGELRLSECSPHYLLPQLLQGHHDDVLQTKGEPFHGLSCDWCPWSCPNYMAPCGVPVLHPPSSNQFEHKMEGGVEHRLSPAPHSAALPPTFQCLLPTPTRPSRSQWATNCDAGAPPPPSTQFLCQGGGTDLSCHPPPSVLLQCVRNQ